MEHRDLRHTKQFHKMPNFSEKVVNQSEYVTDSSAFISLFKLTWPRRCRNLESESRDT